MHCEALFLCSPPLVGGGIEGGGTFPLTSILGGERKIKVVVSTGREARATQQMDVF
jgi:hypothetical protein